MTMSTGPVCPECGIIKKSGRMSCCGRGGSWFGNCGNTGSAILGRTWHEGIRVCQARQFQAVKGQQLNAAQSKPNASSDDDSSDMDSEAVTVIAHMFVTAPDNTTTPLLGTASIAAFTNTSIAIMMTSSHASATASITVRERQKLSHAVTQMIFIIVCWW